MALEFSITHQFIASPNITARVGVLHTAHGKIQTPCFMPPATAGAMKAMRVDDLLQTGTEILLGNTYHLMLRPGSEVLQQFADGLHDFMNWQKPILTDSGGFQIMSLNPLTEITDAGVWFQSHIDGSRHFLSPEAAITIQRMINSDIAMVLDECVSYPAPEEKVAMAMRRSMHWAKLSVLAFQAWFQTQQKSEQGYGIFGINQGGVFKNLRQESAEVLAGMKLDGIAIGGLAVGEGMELMLETLSAVMPLLPVKKPHYLMGVGKPDDIIAAVLLGVDMFDCVLPARSGRHGQVFVRMHAEPPMQQASNQSAQKESVKQWINKNLGTELLPFTNYQTFNLKNAQFRFDKNPLDPSCCCPACRHYSRAYLHHLIRSKEILAAMLLTWHNQQFYQDCMHALRRTITNKAQQQLL